MDGKKYVKYVNLTGTEKRYEPSKHYVYIIDVKWSDGTTFVVYRKYSDFYEMHLELLEQFPKEAGMGGDRVLPYLPTKVLFGRNEVKKVAQERQVQIGEYCTTLVSLKSYISQDDTVIDFFEPKPSDINPPKESAKRAKYNSGIIGSLSLILPKFFQSKEKQRKSSNESKDIDGIADDMYVSGPVSFEVYYVIADYTAKGKGEISLGAGEEVEVIEKNDNGWWLISSCGVEQGWAPASFLEPLNCVVESDEPEPLYNGETYVTIAEYTAELEDEISFPKGVVVDVLHKLLDGWWVISYNDNVGHAPATYLAECHNPHVLSEVVPKKYKKPKLPTQRRCTIKNIHSKRIVSEGKQNTSTFNRRPERDMTLYRQLGNRVSKKKMDSLQEQVSNQLTNLKSPKDLSCNKVKSPLSDRRQLPLPIPTQAVKLPTKDSSPSTAVAKTRRSPPPIPPTNDNYLVEDISEDLYVNELEFEAADDVYSIVPGQNDDNEFEDDEEYINVESPLSNAPVNKKTESRSRPPIASPRIKAQTLEASPISNVKRYNINKDAHIKTLPTPPRTVSKISPMAVAEIDNKPLTVHKILPKNVDNRMKQNTKSNNSSAAFTNAKPTANAMQSSDIVPKKKYLPIKPVIDIANTSSNSRSKSPSASTLQKSHNIPDTGNNNGLLAKRIAQFENA